MKTKQNLILFTISLICLQSCNLGGFEWKAPPTTPPDGFYVTAKVNGQYWRAVATSDARFGTFGFPFSFQVWQYNELLNERSYITIFVTRAISGNATTIPLHQEDAEFRIESPDKELYYRTKNNAGELKITNSTRHYTQGTFKFEAYLFDPHTQTFVTPENKIVITDGRFSLSS